MPVAASASPARNTPSTTGSTRRSPTSATRRGCGGSAANGSSGLPSAPNTRAATAAGSAPGSSRSSSSWLRKPVPNSSAYVSGLTQAPESYSPYSVCWTKPMPLTGSVARRSGPGTASSGGQNGSFGRVHELGS